jgi:HK97 family phage major capsid protein
MDPELKKALGETVEPVTKAVKEVGEKMVATEKAVSDLAGRVEAIEKMPAATAPAVIQSKQYKGYNISKQGANLREAASKTPHQFEAVSTEEGADRMAKFMIDMIKARKFGNEQAKADLQKFYEEMGQKAVFAEGADATGGYVVPDEYIWDMVQLAREATFALRECTVIPMGSDTLYVPTEAGLATVAWRAEAGAVAAGEGSFGQVKLTAKSLAGLATISNEMLADSRIDIVSMLNEQFGYAIAYELDNQVLNGTGDPVSGLLGAACGYSVVMATGSTNFSAITADHLNAAIVKLTSGDMAGAKFILNRLGAGYVRTLKDSQGRPIFAFPSASIPGTIYEYPYFVSEKVTNTTAVSTATALFGNLKKFLIGRRLGVTSIDVDPYGLFSTNSTRFRIATRFGLAIGRASAFARIITAAS